MSDLSYHQPDEIIRYCKAGHALTLNNVYTYKIKGKDYHKCKTCALEYARKRNRTRAKDHDILAERCGELQNQLEVAMPWERDAIKQRIRELYQKSQP